MAPETLPPSHLSHFFLMTLYALIVSLFFAVLWRRRRRDQVVLFLQLFLGMVGGGLIVAWLMYPFPSGPPAPIP
jgi:cytochrome bd-type quinol oxidase subunit 2